MAVHLGAGGNCSITIGGQFNPQVFPIPNNWTNPTSGGTALTGVVSLKPDSPLAGDTGIFHQNDNAFLFRRTSAVPGRLELAIIDQSTNFAFNDRRWQTVSSTALVPGVWNRLAFRWRVVAGVHTVSIMVNGVDFPVTLASSQGTVVAMTQTPGPNNGQPWPIEIGAESAADRQAVFGDYAEAALWGAYLPDADAVKYGQGYSPNLLMPTNRISYHKLLTTGAAWNTTFLDPSLAGSTLNEWTGVLYGAGQPQPFGGIFQTFANATHPSVIYSTHMFSDIPSLPQRRFEPYELEGFPGRRSGVTLAVPSQMTLSAAMTAAQYGDDIVLAAGTLTTGSFTPPTKTATASTPRMPPRGQTPLTSGTPLTG